MSRNFTLLSLVSLLFIFGCGQSKLTSTDTGDIPSWYLNTPQEENYLYQASSATSSDMQTAVDKATADARAGIGRQVEVTLAGIQKSFTEEVGVGENSSLVQQFTEASKNVVSTNLAGTTPIEKKINKDGENWRAYVLVKYPTIAAKEALLKQIKNDQESSTRLRSTEVFKELEMEVKKLQDNK